MLAVIFSRGGGVGEIDTSVGQAIVEERYAALRRQVPVIYIIAVANLCGLELATAGRLDVGFNFPTILAIFAVIRTVQWLRSRPDVSHATMLRRLRQTCTLAAMLCGSVCLWCLYLISGDSSTRMAVVLFGGLTAIGAAYGLSVLPVAARIPIFVLALPLAVIAALSEDPQFVGAALSLALVAMLILRLLSVHNDRFIELIKSRTMLIREQALAESARQEAVTAATTDFLTGLPNRRAFIAALEAEIAKSDETFAVAILDLDNFKLVNDTLGHLSGDQLLQIVATRLLASGDTDTVVARLGGDEFGLLFRQVTRAAQARVIGARVLSEVERVTLISGREIAAAASIGFGLSRHGASSTPSRLMADADLALYEAKRSTGVHLAVFEPRMEAPHQRRAKIERALRLHSVKDRIHLVYQPIIDLASGDPVAIEALARWSDADLGEVSPAEFVPIAEQLNVIGNISDHLLKQALADASRWPETVRLSFNLSAVQLCSRKSAEAIIGALKQAKFDTNRLQVEVTETALLCDFVQARQNLSKLRAAGVTIVLDDFGAGYSSIGYLRELRFDQIKLDGALVTAAQESATGKQLLSAVIGLCQALGVTTVAEHIENEEQRRLVADLGCAAGQGFWLQPPMPATAAAEFAQSGLEKQARAGLSEDRSAA